MVSLAILIVFMVTLAISSLTTIGLTKKIYSLVSLAILIFFMVSLAISNNHNWFNQKTFFH